MVILKKPPVGIKEAKIEKALALMLEAGEKMLVDGIPGLAWWWVVRREGRADKSGRVSGALNAELEGVH